MDTQRKVKFRDIVEINPRESIPKSTPAKYVAMENLLPFTKKISKYEIKKYKGGAKFRNGDTLLARITPCLENGKTAFVDILKENEIGFGSTEYIVIRKKTKITDSHYVYYLSTSPRFRDSAIKLMSGTSGRQRIEIEGLKNLNISLPPLSEQKRIANILSSFDNKIEILKKENKILEDIAENIFKEWFVKYNFPNKDGKPYRDSNGKMIDSELGPIPDGWRVGKLGEIVDVTSGKALPKDDLKSNGQYPLLGANGEIGRTDKYLLNETVIYTGRVGTLGNVFLYDAPAWYSDNTLIISPTQSFLYYIFFVLQRQQLEKLDRGSTQPLITQTDLKNILVVIPDANILQTFAQIVDTTYNKTVKNKKVVSFCSSVKETLLINMMV